MGFNSPSLNPENVLPQWQQKIANAEKIYSSIYNHFGAGWHFLRICAIFCRYWTCSFSGRNNQGIEPEVVCHFHLLVHLFILNY